MTRFKNRVLPNDTHHRNRVYEIKSTPNNNTSEVPTNSVLEQPQQEDEMTLHQRLHKESEEQQGSNPFNNSKNNKKRTPHSCCCGQGRVFHSKYLSS